MCIFFIIQYFEFGYKLFYISTRQTHEHFKLFLYIYPFFLQQHFIYQKIILNIFLHLMIYLFILLLNFFLNGSYSSIEIANFLRIFKFLATFLFNVLLASSLNVSHIQYPVIALCLLTALTNSSTPLLYSLCNTFSVPTFFHFLLLLKLMHLSLLLLFF